MVKKQFTYKGKTLEELTIMTPEEFAKITHARARRCIKHGVNKKLLKKIDNARKLIALGKEPKPIKTHLRDFIVLPSMIGLKFAIHRGNSFEPRDIEKEMLGHYLGELVLTRKKLSHGKAGIGATRSSTSVATRKT